MTEAEFMTSADPAAMLAGLSATGTPLWHGVAGVTPGGIPKSIPIGARKLWLFVAAVERLWWGEMAYPGDVKAVETLEAVADGRLSESRLGGLVFSYTMPWNAADCAREAVRVHNSKGDPPRWAALLREIVGNPWRPVTLPVETKCAEGPRCRQHGCPWLSPTALRLARSIYDSRDWSELPVLADALADCGCEDAAILDHLRGPGPHVRGCWCLDALLGLG